MTRIEQEKKTVRQMIEIYCRGKKHRHSYNSAPEGVICEECRAILEYAYQRLEHCKFLDAPDISTTNRGDNKPTCKKCPNHCYKPAMREQIRQIMRYAGPRMLWHHPIAAIRHLMRELK